MPRLLPLIILTWIMPDALAQDSAERVYPLDSLITQLDTSRGAWLPFITVPTLETGLYRLAPGAEDRQSPHDRDEVYYVIEGIARVRIGDREESIGPGDTVFVRASTEHRFVAIEKELVLLVFFSSAEP